MEKEGDQSQDTEINYAADSRHNNFFRMETIFYPCMSKARIFQKTQRGLDI